MKPYIDMFETNKGLFIANKRLKNRFKKYWGVTTVDGVEVFNRSLQVWPGTDNTNVAAILKMFGLYQSIKSATFEGITSYRLFLNPEKTESLADVDKDIAVNHLNAIIPDSTFDIELNYYDPDPAKFNGYTESDIVDYFASNYKEMKKSGRLECRADTIVTQAIGYYVLLDTSGNFNKVIKDGAFSSIQVPVGVTDGVFNRVNSTLSQAITVTVSVKQVSPIAENDLIVTEMLNESNPVIKNEVITALGIGADMDVDSLVEHIWEARSIFNHGANLKTDELWYKGQLRTAVLDGSYLDRRKFATVLATAIDTEYTKKKTKWYKKILSFVIMVVAVWLSIPSGGLSTAAALSAFAVNLGIATLVLTAIQYALAKAGDTAWAQYMGRFVQVIGIASMVAGVAAFVQNIAKRGLMNVITESFTEFTTELAGTFGVETVGTAAAGAEAGAAASIAAGGVTMEGGATLATKSLFSKAMDFLGSKLVSIGRKVAEYAMDQRINTAAKELGDATALAEQSREELIELTDKEMHIAVEDIKYYTSPLKLDNLPFEVDYLYEGTKYNICRPSFVPTGLNIIDK